MAKYANQWKVVINRMKVEKGTNEPFLCIHTNSIETAARELSGTEFKLYMYFASNANGYELDYSTQHFANIYGCGLTAARDAFKGLQEKGYLVNMGGNQLYFVESVNIHKEDEKRGLKDKSGEIKYYTYKELIEIYGKTADLLWENAIVQE